MALLAAGRLSCRASPPHPASTPCLRTRAITRLSCPALQLLRSTYNLAFTLHAAAVGVGFAGRAVERVLATEREKGGDLQFEDILDDVAGVYPKVMIDGDMEIGAWSCGMVAGLIHDIPTCKQLIDGIMTEADALIRKRLEGMLAA